MDEKGLITDEVIQFVNQSICEKMEKEMGNERVDVVGPNVVYYIQKLENREDIKEQKRGLGLEKLDWVIYPVNDNEDPEKGDGGTHWSLLLYSKEENKYYHFDPIKGMNARHAKNLHIKLLDTDSYDKDGNLPPFVEVKCKRHPC